MPQHFPSADGAAPPAPDAADRHDRIKLEFLAAYYRLNRGSARLREVRRRKSAGTAAAPRTESGARRAVEQALLARDELEDRYAPYGIIAEPILENGFVVDVKFSFGDLQSRKNAEIVEIVTSAYVAIPLPAGWADAARKAAGPK